MYLPSVCIFCFLTISYGDFGQVYLNRIIIIVAILFSYMHDCFDIVILACEIIIFVFCVMVDSTCSVLYYLLADNNSRIIQINLTFAALHWPNPGARELKNFQDFRGPRILLFHLESTNWWSLAVHW